MDETPIIPDEIKIDLKSGKFVLNKKSCNKLFIKLTPMRLTGGSFNVFYISRKEDADFDGVYIDREQFNFLFGADITSKDYNLMYKYLSEAGGKLKFEMKNRKQNIKVINSDLKNNDFSSFNEVLALIRQKIERVKQ